MAAMLLAGGASLALSGCLLFEDYPVLPTVPPELNGPMQILSGNKKPEQRVSTLTVASGCTDELYITIDDENQSPDGGADLTDRSINSLWFVPGYTAVKGNGVPHWGVRQVLATADVFKNLRGLTDGSPHLIEVRVTDGYFQQVGDVWQAQRDQITLPDGTRVDDPVYEDSWVWQLTLVGSCP